MEDPIRFDQDWHASSTFSDGTATVAENADAAEALGLRSRNQDSEVAREQIEAEELFAARAVEWLVHAYANATRRDDVVVLARPFDVLARLGVDQGAIHPSYMRWLAGAMLESEACGEINESWRAPSPLVVDCFLTAGVTVLPASGARSPAGLGPIRVVLGGRRRPLRPGSRRLSES